MPTPAYVTYEEAETYCLSGLAYMYDGWFQEEDDEKRSQSLVTASQIIDLLPLLGLPATIDQELAFPRAGQTEVPKRVKYACIEIAVALLSGRIPQMDFEELAIVSSKAGRVSETRDTNIRLPHILAGIPSFMGWKLIAPYVRREDRSIPIERVD